MKLLKKENYWIWILLLIVTGSASNITLAILLDCFDKKAWYSNPKNWLLGLACFVFPFVIMIAVFNIQMLCMVNAKLETPGKELYLSPYVWILLLIVPIIGWILFLVLLVYLTIWPIVMIYRGNGKKFIGA